MSSSFRNHFQFLVFFLITANFIFSQNTPQPEPQFEEKEESPSVDRFRKRELEIGLRGGVGYKPEDRFEAELKNYKTESAPYVISNTEVSPFRRTSHWEIFARMRVFTNSKFGVVYGSTRFQNFNLTEYTNLGFFTRLNFKFKTDFFFLTYHYEIPYKKYTFDLGVGLGVNTITWQTNGAIFSRFGFTEQSGFMVGNGLGYRMDASVSRKINDFTLLQLGVFYNYYTVPFFNGGFNDGFGSYFVRDDGSVTVLQDSSTQQTIYETSEASRRLDVRVGTFMLYAGVLLRVNF